MANKLRTISFHGIPRPNFKWLLVTLIFSAVVHLISVVKLDQFGTGLDRGRMEGKSKSTVKMKVIPVKKPKPAEDQQAKRILETKLEPTAKPKEARYKGAQDHIAEKETRVERRSALNDLDAGMGRPIGSDQPSPAGDANPSEA